MHFCFETGFGDERVNGHHDVKGQVTTVLYYICMMYYGRQYWVELYCT